MQACECLRPDPRIPDEHGGGRAAARRHSAEGERYPRSSATTSRPMGATPGVAPGRYKPPGQRKPAGATGPAVAPPATRPSVLSLGLLLRLSGDRVGEVLVLLALGAAQRLDLDELGLGKIHPALLGIGLAEIFTRVDVLRVDGQGPLVVGHALVEAAAFALGVADHGENHRIVLVSHGGERAERLRVASGKGEGAALRVELLVVEQAGGGLDAGLLVRVVDIAGLAGRRAAPAAAAAAAVRGECRADGAGGGKGQGNEAGPGEEPRYFCHRGLPEQCSHGWALSRVTTYMNTRPPRDISHAEQRSRSREGVPGGAAPLPFEASASSCRATAPAAAAGRQRCGDRHFLDVRPGRAI